MISRGWYAAHVFLICVNAGMFAANITHGSPILATINLAWVGLISAALAFMERCHGVEANAR